MNYELGTPQFAIFGAIAGFLWIINYLAIFKTAQVYIPLRYVKKRPKFSRFLIFILGLSAWVLICYSLAQPRKPIGYSKDTIEVNDIFFVVDVSRSMLADDFEPNRLEAAKIKIKEFVKLRPTDRIGIIMFAEKVFTLLPLSTDLDLVERIVDEIRIGFLGNGTNIGDALGLAVGRAAQSLAENKVIILLTDGVSNVGSMTPLQAAEEAKEQNVKIYTIGIGGDKNARIPVPGSRFPGRLQYIPGGSIDLKTLKEIADTTGGKDFLAQDDQALTNVLAEIGELEKTEIDASGRVIYEELYLKYLLYGLLMLMLSEILRKFGLREVE